MLESLRISNLILIEEAALEFGPGFNVLTGETGAGKSGVLEAIRLVCGERADTSVIRKGAKKARVDATLNLSKYELLDSFGIEYEKGEPLIVSRELSSTGGSKAFINNQPVTLKALKEIAQHLVKCVGQHAGQQLFSLEKQRALLDRFGTISSKKKSFRDAYKKYKEALKRLQELQSEETKRLRRLETLRREVEEIDAFNPVQGEDEELFQEFSILNHAEEFRGLLSEISEGLEGRGGILSKLLALRPRLEQASEIDESLSVNVESFAQALIELQDVAATLDQKSHHVEANPNRLQELDFRLKDLHRLKKMYGPELSDVITYLENAKLEITECEGADEEIQKLEKLSASFLEETDKAAAELTKEREVQAKKLSQAVTKALERLNMAKAVFTAILSPTSRTEQGDDTINFILAPNPGEKAVAVSESASGGELSRVMLALQSELSGKEEVGTVLFDEIDSGIGGHTSTLVGLMLEEIGSRHQVIAVTHFPQVASKAQHHLQITKSEQGARTVTTVSALDELGKKEELQRMLGITTNV